MIEMIFFFMGISWGIQGLVFFCYLLKLECSADVLCRVFVLVGLLLYLFVLFFRCFPLVTGFIIQCSVHFLYQINVCFLSET